MLLLYRKTLRGETAACLPSCTDSEKSVSTSTAHNCANPEPADARGWSDLTVCRHMGACTRARVHTHTPNYLRDGESRCGLARRAVTHTQGAGRLCKAVSFSSPPPYRFSYWYNNSRALKVSHLRREFAFFNYGGVRQYPFKYILYFHNG